MKVVIVLPVYNERENVIKLLPALFQTFKQFKIQGKVIVVDDNSPDGTASEVEKLKSKFPITLIKRKERLGLGSAYIEGFKKALKNKSDLIFQMDADLSHQPKYIPKFIEKLKNYDVVIGSRLMKGGGIVGWNFTRILISWGGNLIGRYIASINVSDLTSGYRVYKREVLQSIDLDKIKSKSYAFQLEMLAIAIKKGFKVGTIPIIFYERKYGKSKLTKSDQLRFLITAIKIRVGIL